MEPLALAMPLGGVRFSKRKIPIGGAQELEVIVRYATTTTSSTAPTAQPTQHTNPTLSYHFALLCWFVYIV